MTIKPDYKIQSNSGNYFISSTDRDQKILSSEEERVHAYAVDARVLPAESGIEATFFKKGANSSRFFETRPIRSNAITKNTVFKGLGYATLAAATLGLVYLASSTLRNPFNFDNQNVNKTLNLTQDVDSQGASERICLVSEHYERLLQTKKCFENDQNIRDLFERNVDNRAIILNSPTSSYNTDDSSRIPWNYHTFFGEIKPSSKNRTENTTDKQETSRDFTHKQFQLLQTFRPEWHTYWPTEINNISFDEDNTVPKHLPNSSQVQIKTDILNTFNTSSVNPPPKTRPFASTKNMSLWDDPSAHNKDTEGTPTLPTNAEEAYNFGKTYLSKEKWSPSEAFKYFEHAAKLNHTEAQRYVGILYQIGEGTSKSHEKALDYYKLAADKNDDEAQFLLARMYQLGLGTEPSHELAEKYYNFIKDKGAVNQDYKKTKHFKSAINNLIILYLYSKEIRSYEKYCECSNLIDNPCLQTLSKIHFWLGGYTTYLRPYANRFRDRDKNIKETYNFS